MHFSYLLKLLNKFSHITLTNEWGFFIALVFKDEMEGDKLKLYLSV